MVFAFAIFACNTTVENKVPTDFLPKADFKKILTDFHLANAAEQHNKIVKDSTMFKYAESYHDFIYKSNNISKEDFETTLKYYFSNPKLLDDIYTEIIEDLTKLEAKTKVKIDE